MILTNWPKNVVVSIVFNLEYQSILYFSNLFLDALGRVLSIVTNEYLIIILASDSVCFIGARLKDRLDFSLNFSSRRFSPC